MTHSEEVQAKLKGKTIKSADVNGHRVFLIFTDGSQFNYDASDGGYSCFSFYESKVE